jgi:hypothetical protein
MATRRHHLRRDAAALLSAVLFGPLPWPGRTVRLEPDSLADYRARLTSPQVPVAELYHENSKLSRELLPALAMTTVDPAQVRQEFLRRRAALAQVTPGHRFDGMDAWHALLRPAAAARPGLFYAIELRLLTGGELLAYEPAGDSFSLLKGLDATEGERLAAALSLVPGGGLTDGESLLVVLACFPRNEILFGQHGYRRTLLEAGQVTQSLLRAAEEASLTARACYEFATREVDRIMEVDGVEHSTLVTIACR